MFGVPRQCPSCGGPTFFASRSGFWRPILACVLIRPFRCDHCNRRVWRLSPFPGPTRPAKSDPKLKR